MLTVSSTSIESSGVRLRSSPSSESSAESGVSASGEKFGDVLNQQSTATNTGDARQQTVAETPDDGNVLQSAGNNLPGDESAEPESTTRSPDGVEQLVAEQLTAQETTPEQMGLAEQTVFALPESVAVPAVAGAGVAPDLAADGEESLREDFLRAKGFVVSETARQTEPVATAAAMTTTTSAVSTLTGQVRLSANGSVQSLRDGAKTVLAEAEAALPQPEIGEQLRNFQQALALNKAVSSDQQLMVEAGGAQSKPVSGQAVQSASVVSGALPLQMTVDPAAGGKIPITGALPTPVAHHSWGNEFSGQVTFFVRQGVQEASLQLTPPDLGRLDIKITTDGDQTKMLFTVQNATAREAIEQAMPRLREMLDQAGLQLAHSEVADHSQSRHKNNGANDAFTTRNTLAELEESGESKSVGLSLRVSDSLVDYYI
ncbi:MAG: flagellar hook-length control protein FliK [Porticoccaceae bacterium]|nr:flagellar hook-length control protein FliK [Pseudomonadales bacterium]MCP5173031.1 flagellar hook-length control protein FliK [Pseudomonadales bacterium]MCP5302505.1 flagellar hook-length control protein FliK [Pseudomonadales bacterium]